MLILNNKINNSPVTYSLPFFSCVLRCVLYGISNGIHVRTEEKNILTTLMKYIDLIYHACH